MARPGTNFPARAPAASRQRPLRRLDDAAGPNALPEPLLTVGRRHFRLVLWAAHLEKGFRQMCDDKLVVKIKKGLWSPLSWTGEILPTEKFLLTSLPTP